MPHEKLIRFTCRLYSLAAPNWHSRKHRERKPPTGAAIEVSRRASAHSDSIIFWGLAFTTADVWKSASGNAQAFLYF